jgi:hypothetical protein
MLGMRGRKFGVNVVFAAHEFTKEQVGLLRNQCNVVVCFRTSSKELATKLGCKGAELIPADRAGLCVTSLWGPMQAYFADKSLLMDGEQPAGEALDPETARVFETARDHYEGKVTATLLKEMMNLSAREAGRQQRTWAARNWLVKDGKQANAFVLTDRGLALIGEKRKTRETPQNAEKPAENRKTDENGG